MSPGCRGEITGIFSFHLNILNNRALNENLLRVKSSLRNMTSRFICISSKIFEFRIVRDSERLSKQSALLSPSATANTPTRGKGESSGGEDTLYTYVEVAEDRIAGSDARKRKETTGGTRCECLAFFAINSNGLEKRESADLLSGRRRMHRGGEEWMRCHATAALTRYTLRNPRNWTTINDRQRLYDVYIFFPDHMHTRAFCASLAILTFQYWRRRTSGKISSPYRRDRRLLRKRLSRNRIVRLSTLSSFVSFMFRTARPLRSYQSGAIKSTRFSVEIGK